MKWNQRLTGIFAKTVKEQSPTTRPCTPYERIPSIRGYREDLGVIHDSKMEANVHRFYKYLSKRYGKIEVEYEPKGFKFGDNNFNIRYYVPDFKIRSGKMVWFVEVKGFVSNTSRQKAKLVSTHYPGINIYYVLPKHYKLIEKHYARSIPNWE